MINRRDIIADTIRRGYCSLSAEAALRSNVEHHNYMSQKMDEREHLLTTSKRGHPEILELSPNGYVNFDKSNVWPPG